MASIGLPMPVSAEVPQSITFLSPEEQNQIPAEVKNKILVAVQDLNRRFHNAVASREQDKSTSDQRIEELEKELVSHSSKIAELKNLFNEESKSTSVYIEKYRDATTLTNELEAKVRQSQQEAHESKLKCEQAISEKEDLSSIIEKRNNEIEKLMKDITSLGHELKSATVAKITAINKVDEMVSKEMELEYREKQLQKESEWVQKQVQLLNEELDRKNAEMINQQKESAMSYLALQLEVTEKSEKVHVAEMTLANVKQSNEEQEKHIERLIEKLRDAQEVEAKLVENYRQELKSQKRIADLYKESSEEACSKVEELQQAVGNLQELLQHATERYGDLETRSVNAGKSFQEEITQRETTIEGLKKELLDANELLSSIKKHGMTDEMIQSLSPAAAAASNMLKGTHSLTEIYSRYQSLHSELTIAKMDNEKLNNYIGEIVKDIEERSPGIRQQREDYENAVRTVDVLNSQLELVMEENGKCKTEVSVLKKSTGSLERENERLKLQLADLALQVKTLIKEVEMNRGNYRFEREEPQQVPNISSGNAAQVISDRLVTFRNIEELQSQNQQLLSVVRELSDTQESAERRISENQMKQIKEAFEEAKAEMEELRAIRIRQDKNLEQVVKQRDMYSALLKQSKSAGGGGGEKLQDSFDVSELEKKLFQAQTSLASAKEDYDNYRKEKAINDRMTDESMEKLRDEVAKMRAENARLASQIEYNNERTKIYNANLQTYKKNIAVLEEKNNQYSVNVHKFEQNVQALKSELQISLHKLSQAEVALNSMTLERNGLRDVKSRLQAERDMFLREKSTQLTLQTNLEEIKNTLEKATASHRMRLENQNDTLQQEVNMLRQKADTENDRFKNAVHSWETTNTALRDKLKSEQNTLTSIKQELELSKKEIERLTVEIDTLKNERSGPASTSTPSSTTAPAYAVDVLNPKIFSLEKKTKELNLQLIDSQTEIRSLRHQLDVYRGNIDEYKSLCASLEEQLKSSANNSTSFNDDLNERLACKDDIIRDIQLRLDTSEKENHSLKEERTAVTDDFETKRVRLEEEISRMRRELQSANLKLQGEMQESCNIKKDMELNNQTHKELLQKSEAELAACKHELQLAGELKTKLEQVQAKLQDEEISKMKADTALREARNSFEQRENTLNENMEALKKNMADLETLNATLQNHLVSVTNQMNSLQQTGKTQDATTEGSEKSAENDPKNSEQWLELIKYLRREKEIANAKTEMAVNTSNRLENQLKFLNKQCEELQKQLSDSQSGSQATVLTSAKQAELLRKVETLSALTDSNRMLREEKDNALKEITELRSKLEQIEGEIGPLRLKNMELDSRCETLSGENTAAKQDVSRWRARASALLEKSNKVNPEEMKKLQIDNDNLQKQLQSVQDTVKKLQQENQRQLQQIRMIQQQSTVLQSTNQSLQQAQKSLQEEIKRVQDENSKFKSENETTKTENDSLKTAVPEKDAAIKKLKTDLTKSKTETEEQKGVVRQVRAIARRYKKQYEDLLAANDAKVPSVEKPAAGSEANVATAGTTTEDLTSEQTESLDAADTRDARINELVQENERLKQEVENFKGDSSQKHEQTKLAMKSVRDKLALITQQKDEFHTQLEQANNKVASMEVSSEENSVRFAALKSQYEGRLSRLEKENKELKAANASNSPLPGSSDMTSANSALQQENDRLKKELDMLRQRILALEKQFKLQSQQHSSKSAAPSGDKVQTDPPKANIKPIAGTSSSSQKPATQIVPTTQISRPPLTASIRPMSMLRKATVMPTTASSATAMPTQQSQQSQQQPSSLVQPLPYVAPVSQAQVSTSTPDQSSATETSTQHLPVTSSASSTPTATNSANVRQATVQPTLTVSVAPIASSAPSAVASVVAPQGTSDNEPVSAIREDPSTSHVMDSEMGDSSEQVSSSESSHQPMLTVAPIRSQQQDHVQQSSQTSAGNQNSASVEEPSPSTSTSSRVSQSVKRGRDNEVNNQKVETSQEIQHCDEPETKRSRTMPMSMDREAEAMSHQQEQPHQQSDSAEYQGQEQEADQGRNEDENQMPHSDTSENKPAGSSSHQRGRQDDDDDSDVIVIESDDDDMPSGHRVMTHRQQKQLDEDNEEDNEDDEDEDDEDVDDEDDDDEELDDDEEIEDEEDVDDEHDDQDEMDPDEGEEQEEDDVQHEDREAESLEHESQESQEADRMDLDGQGAEADILEEPEYENIYDGDQGDDQERHDEVESAGTAELEESHYRRQTFGDASGSSVPGSLVRDSSPGTSSDVVRLTPGHQSSGSRALPRTGRQDRLPSYVARQQLTPSSFQGQYGDEADDSIVPSTPILFVQRRSDGFAEAVSSPQIPSQPRFTFSAPSDTTTPAGSSEIEDTRVDLMQYDDSTGRSVPTTPLQVSPPDVADLSSELDSQVDDMHESQSMSQEIMDVQPSSSDVSGSTNNVEVPTITVTSAQVDSAVDQGSQDNDNVVDYSELTGDTQQGHSVPSGRTEVSVTSSDEDKLDGTAAVQLQPTTSSRAASPTPSSAQPNVHDQPIPQQHRVRPTPIIWDQPTSSSSSVPQMTRIPRGRGGLLRTMPAPPEQGLNMSMNRGNFRQLRGAQQSARRSRPHSRGIVRGSPFNKPY